ncbi:MAG: FkbM family methyltransferase [Verrucomicrobiales bacterium]|nr:FkbM family methyltransferase [Verrucomicrobiales bacterium]
MAQISPESVPVLDRWPVGKRLFFRLNPQLRRAHRLFRAFPVLPYRHFLDVGAFEGEFTDSVLSYFQPDRVWQVEADPDQSGLLQAKYREESRVKVIPAAIADQSGTLEFHVNQHRPSSSLIPIASSAAGVFQKEMNEARVVRVPALSLDELFEKEALPDIDLMKVDIQGAERLLIQGGTKSLKRIRLVFMEVWFQECYQGSALFPEVQTMMTGSGFKLRSFHEFRKGSDGNLVYSNALYYR